MVSRTQLRLIALGATAALGVAALTWQKHEKRGRGLLFRPSAGTLVDAARSLNRGAGLLATSVALDSGQGQQDPDAIASKVRDPIYLLAGLTGVAGTGFHLYNVTRRPGGLSWSNLFYAAPLGAPLALMLSGLLGYYSERLRNACSDAIPRVFGLPAGRSVALMIAGGLLGTTAEAGLLHFRGSFQNPAMYLPVTAPPLAAGLLAASALTSPRRHRLRWLSRLALRFTAFMGFAGTGFHAFGIARNHGGWRNWRQNLQAGPPLPAPPSFTGLALAGLAAHSLLDEEKELKHYRWWT